MFKRASLRIWLTSSLTLVSVGVSSCSPTMFGGSAQDQKVVKQRGYREIPTSCSGLKLERPDLDAPTFRQLLGCLNSNGTLDAYEKIARRMKDDELQPVLDVMNRTVLSRPERLHAVIRSFKTLKKNGSLNRVFKQFGTWVSNEEFVGSTIALLKQAYRVEGPKLLAALEKLAPRFSPENAEIGIEGILSVVSSNSYQSLIQKMAASNRSGRTMDFWVTGLLSYLQSDQRVLRGTGRRALETLADQRFWKAMDGVLDPLTTRHARVGGPVAEGELKAGVPELAAVIETLTSRREDIDGNVMDGAFLDGFISAFDKVHRPVTCLNQTQSVQDGALFLVEEFARFDPKDVPHYLLRDRLLLFSALGPFCDYPAGIEREYQSCAKMSQMNIMPMSVKAVDQMNANGMVPWLLDFMADPSLRQLIPLLAEGTDKSIWQDLLLMLMLPRDQDRETLGSALKVLLEPEIFGVIDSALSNVKTVDLITWVRSIDRFLESPEPNVLPAFEGLRSAYHSSDVFPVLDTLKEILGQARANEAMFSALFNVADQSEFKDAVKLTSQMAKDGRLQDLLDTALSLFEHFAKQGHSRSRRGVLIAGQEPAFVPSRRHNLSSADLTAYRVQEVPELVAVAKACADIDINVSLDSRDDGTDRSPIAAHLRCMAAQGVKSSGDPMTIEAIEFLRQAKTAQGDSYFNFVIGELKQLESVLSKGDGGSAATQDFTTRLVNAVRDQRFTRAFQGLGLFLADPSRGGGGLENSVAEALIALPQPILEKGRETFRSLSDFGGALIRHKDFAASANEVHQLIRSQPEGDEELVDENELREQNVRLNNLELDEKLAALIRARECVGDSRTIVRRIEEIKEDFFDATTNWDLVDGRARRDTSIQEFKTHFEPLFQKLGDPAQNSDERTATQGMVNVLRYFSKEFDPSEPVDSAHPDLRTGAHYSPEYLLRWLRERSSDFSPISFFYPGETKPRVRLVNTLDRLELVLISADFTYMVPQNFGMQFLAEIGEAWGDESPAIWPEEIKKKYPRYDRGGKRPATLRQAYESILKTKKMMETMIGFPKLPSCPQLGSGNEPRYPVVPVPLNVKAALYNINQVVGVIEENLPDYAGPNAGGMRVLRDLFFEMYYSTPEKARNPRSGFGNNLKVISKLVQAGLMRQISRQLMKFPPVGSNPKDYYDLPRLSENAAAIDMIRALVLGASTPSAPKLMTILFDRQRDPGHRLLWKVLEKIFVVAESGAVAAKRMRQTAFYGLAALNRFKVKSLYDVLSPAVAIMVDVLDQNGRYLISRADTIEDVLKSKTLGLLAADFYVKSPESMDLTHSRILRFALSRPEIAPDAVRLIEMIDGNIDTLSDRWDVVRAHPDFDRLELKKTGQDLLGFLLDPVSPASQRTREFMARFISGSPSSLENLMLMAKDHPAETRQVLKTLLERVRDNTVIDFVETAKRALSPRI